MVITATIKSLRPWKNTQCQFFQVTYFIILFLIILAQQALQLDGVGAKMAALIGNMIQKKYSQNLLNSEAPVQLTLSQQSDVQVEPLSTQDILQDYNQHSQDADLTRRMRRFETLFTHSPIRESQESRSEYLSESQSSNYISYAEYKNIWDPIKRSRDEEYSDPFTLTLKKSKTTDLDSENSRSIQSTSFKKAVLTASKSLDVEDIGLKTTKKKKNYRPEKGSTGYFILIGLLAFENDTKKKYATKKEIKAYLKKAVDTLGPMEIKNWSTLPTLIKNELVLPFTFNDEEKYSLTDQGVNIATELHMEQLQVYRDSKNQSVKETSNTDTTSRMFSEMRHEETKSTVDTTVTSTNNEYSIFPFLDAPKREAPEEREESINFSQAERMFSRSQSQTFKPSQSLARREKLMEKIEDSQRESNGTHTHKILKSNFFGRLSYHLGTITKLEVVLYVDNREVKNKNERNYVFDKISAVGINCKSLPLPVGDFLWVVNVQGN